MAAEGCDCESIQGTQTHTVQIQAGPGYVTVVFFFSAWLIVD